MSLFGCSSRIATGQSCCLVISHAVSGNEFLRRSFATTLVSLAGKKSRRFRPSAPLKTQNTVIKAATWLALDPSTVEPSDLLEQLKTVHDSSDSSSFTLHTAVFLVTPSFHRWLDVDNDFLSDAVHELFSSQVNDASEIRTISAIVDRIPSDNKTRIENADVGNEGISILLSSELIRSRPAGQDIAEEIPDKSHIRFLSQSDTKERHLVALPVANTLFHNGHHTTSFQDFWQWHDQHEQGKRFSRKARMPLKSFDVTTSSLWKPLYIGVPLAVLTRPQEVSSGMGNIIRELKRRDTGESFPASMELEAAVSQFLSSPWLTDSARRNFAVFALTSRKDFYEDAKAEVRAGIWPPLRASILKGLLQGQAQMHRVTGGGGGWGNKKGLLSLEPGNDLFNTQHGQRLPLHQQGENYAFKSASSVVLPGDSVQFFAVFSGPQDAPGLQLKEWLVRKRAAEEEARSEGKKHSKDSTPRIVIGTIPPEEQYLSTINDASPSGDNLRFLPNHFGMFSQGGACLGRDTTSGGASAIFTSRLDIPYTTIVVKTRPEFREIKVLIRRVLSGVDDSQSPLSDKQALPKSRESQGASISRLSSFPTNV